MSLVDTNKLAEARVGYNKAFQKGFTGSRAVALVPLLAMVAESTSTSTKFPIGGGLQRFKEFAGERMFQDFSRYSHELKNRTFTNDVEVSLDDFEDEQFGAYDNLFEQLGMQAAQWEDDLVEEVLLAGETVKGYDDVALFSASHKLESGVAGMAMYPNLFTGTALTEANFDAVYNAMSVIPARDGRPVPWGKDVVLIVPPQLETTGKKIVQASQNANGATNVVAGKARVVTLQGLYAEPTNWMLADLGQALKPVILSRRKAARLTPPRGTEDYILEKRVLRWFGDARGAAGVGAPWLIAKAKA